jgi:phthalate 4,5-dioxygenase
MKTRAKARDVSRGGPITRPPPPLHVTAYPPPVDSRPGSATIARWASTVAFEVDADPMHQNTKANHYIKADGNVIFEIEKNPCGLTLYGRRNGEPDSYYWRVTQWLFPWFTLIPPFGEHALGGHVWVPIDDHNCWAWSINFHPNKPLSQEERRHMAEGKGIHCAYEPGGTFRPLANKDNDYLIDRRAQKERLRTWYRDQPGG